VVPGWQILLLPVFVLLALLAAIGPAIWAASLIVKYRDFRFIIPFVTQIGLYVSPVGFSSKVVPEHWQMLYSINPMVGVIDGFRWCILGGDSPIYWPGFLVSLVVIAGMLVWGTRSFRRSERAFADMV
jgi:lipopolysaccharide transport system permease protein